MKCQHGDRSDPVIVPLEACTDRAVVGGKAVGLGKLLRSGFPVPPGICITTAAFREAATATEDATTVEWNRLNRKPDREQPAWLEEKRRRIQCWRFPDPLAKALHTELDKLEQRLGGRGYILWAVRSSATSEDGSNASFAGMYETTLGVIRARLEEAVLNCWASLWKSTAWGYSLHVGNGMSAPEMAVIVQPLLDPFTAGVAYSRNPVTGREDVVAINAVFGLAEPLVSGQASPDSVLVQLSSLSEAGRVLERKTEKKHKRRHILSVGGKARLVDEALPDGLRNTPTLSDSEAKDLARLVRKIENVFRSPVDIEWALDDKGWWILQARPVPPIWLEGSVTDHLCCWSRANFKETLPELPSPLALSYLREFMEHAILRQYREIGCHIPPGLSAVRILHGRPYINVTLFQMFAVQLGSDPDLVVEQMGGEVRPVGGLTRRLSIGKLFWAGLRLEWRVWRAKRLSSGRFAELRQLGEAQFQEIVAFCGPQELLGRLKSLSQPVYHGDLTFAIVSGVAQALYVLGMLLKNRIHGEWRSLLNAATQGLGGIISANQILWLVKLAEKAQGEHAIRECFLGDPWEPKNVLSKLAGTRFLLGLEAFLKEYGHRAIGESDVMSPRFAEMPDYLLGIIRSHLKAGTMCSHEEIVSEQETARRIALEEIRKILGWRLHEWLWFRWWHRNLAQYLELREANRHQLMYYAAGVRHLLLLMGRKLADQGRLGAAEDVFFLTQEELESVLTHPEQNWVERVRLRREERAQNAQETAPDMVCGPWPFERDGTSVEGEKEEGELRGQLKGITISAGYTEGPVRVIRSASEVERVRSGDILVMPVIDPGWAPLLGLAAGLIVEMGGTLSHGAIIAREYGLPALVNVKGATGHFTDGEWVAIDATRGVIRRLEGTSEHSGRG